MSFRRALRTAPLVGGLGLLSIGLAAGCGGSSPQATTSAPPAPPAPVTLHYQIKPDGQQGPDGKMHDSFFQLDNPVVKVGQQVTIDVKNYDGGQHSMTFTDLGLNLLIPGKDKGSTDPASFTYTFTPTKAGKFRWYCAIPCDGGANARWAMSDSATGPGQDNFMAGYLTVQ